MIVYLSPVNFRKQIQPNCNIVFVLQVSILHVAPPIVSQLLRSPLVSKYDLSHVHTVLSGAAPLSAQLTRQLEAKMTGVVVTQGTLSFLLLFKDITFSVR